MARQQPTPNPDRAPEAAARPSRRRDGGGGVRFLIKFVVAVAVFYAISFLPWFREHVFPAYLRQLASISAAILPAMEPDVTSAGSTVTSPRFAIDIRAGCDALEPMALLVAGVLAAPVRWKLRLVGVLGGVGVLFLANIGRIVGLFVAGVHAPRAFSFLHLDVGQALFVFLAVVLWLGWALWAARRSPELQHARA